ncbi:uncharacterized protein LOC127843669 [Dreissena polymorpha]|uniref:Uncharacterized protein n=1 Tax=Dreissena polymorpha TaxID=45954 RepID=A0A9D4E201_DREPO|nr:uncharacterized protein LOC127843669 [Dreissena polymorpha]KAH3771328.1 hypothetical protein DPMN_172643 [Dreissena polymorpha]
MKVVHMYDEIKDTSDTVYEDLNTKTSRGSVEHLHEAIDVAKLESARAEAELFRVTVEPCPLAKRCDIEGAMIMFMTNLYIVFEDPRTRQNKYVFQMPWVRRFGY